MVVAALAASLLGLMVMQAVLLDGVRRQKDLAFDRAARTALAQVATRLDSGEVVEQIRLAATPLDTVIIMDNATVYRADVAHRSVMAGMFPDTLPARRSDRLVATWMTIDPGAADSLNVERFISNLGRQQTLPVVDRLDLDRLDTLLPAALREAGLDMAVDYGVIDVTADSLVVRRGEAAASILAGSAYRARLFPSAFFGPDFDLVAHFPGRAAWAWRQIAPLLLASVVLTTLVILCTVYGVRTILAQRRFAAELVTFVDNLTHELKTPLATMALASEAMARPDVQDDRPTLARYSGMITDEVRRLREHVDRILQLAHLERGELAVEREPVDTHEVLRSVLEGFALQVAERGGRLTEHLSAERRIVDADPVHLAGMVANLLDNAVKYSPDAPAVELATVVRESHLDIVVCDRGVGVPLAQRRRVFDRYYRCQRGDRHDVKGFGLGLNYVRHMAQLHGGHVRLQGRAGGGTEVTLSLPLLREERS